MIHYEIDFTINGEWHHTCGDSTFPSDANFDSKNYSDADIVHNSEILIGAYMKMGHIKGYVDTSNISWSINKIQK